MQRRKHRLCGKLAERTIYGVERLLPQVQVQETAAAQISLTLLLTSAEQFRAMLLLLDNGLGTHAPGPIRSILEALADIVLLSKDPEYLHQLEFDNARANVSFMERYLEALENAGDAEVEIGQLKAKLEPELAIRAELKAKGYKRQTREEKFELSGVDDLHVSYGILCTFVHPNMTSLMARHVGEAPTFAYRRPPVAEVATMITSIGLRVFLQVIEQIPLFTNIPREIVHEFVAEIHGPHTEVMGAG